MSEPRSSSPLIGKPSISQAFFSWCGLVLSRPLFEDSHGYVLASTDAHTQSKDQ